MKDLVLRVDEFVGESLERGLRAHHRRRLSKLGWGDAFEAGPGGWASGNPPPRAGNSVEVLIDGAETFAAMIEAVRGACSHVHVAGWHVAPDFVLKREAAPVVLRELLADAAGRVEVRVLLWAGAPLPPPLTPSRWSVRAASEELQRGGNVMVGLDAKERLLHCHHEKIVVVDDQIAFVGGLDFTRLGGDRLDGSAHPERGALGWHDVATRLRGPVVADVAHHFAMRWEGLLGGAPRRLPHSGNLRASSKGCGAVHLSRESISLVLGDRGDSGRQAPQSSQREFQNPLAVAGEALDRIG